MPIVAMPDGTQVNFPDDMPNEQIKGLIASKFPEVAKPVAAPFDPFNQRKRGAELANIVAATGNKDVVGSVKTGKQSLGEGMFQAGMGEVGALLGDVPGAIAGAALKYHPMGKLYKKGFEQLPEGAQQIPARVASVVAPIAKQYSQNLEAYNQANPRAGRNLQAVRELANVLPLGSGTVRKVGSEAISGVGAAGKNVVTDTLAKNVPELTSAQRKVYAGALYDVADEVGGALKPEARQTFRDTISKLADEGGEKLTSEKSIFEDMLKTTEGNIDKPLTLKTFKTYDQKLTDLIHKERSITGISPEGYKLMELQDNLRGMVENPSPEMVVGGSKGFDVLRKATNEYKLSKQQQEFERIVDFANGTDNPATSMKNQLRVLARNDKRMAGYPPEIRKMIKKGAVDNKFADFLRTTAGSRLIGGMVGGMAGAGGGAAFGGGVGAIPGAIAGAVTGMASRGAATAMKAGQIKKIEKAITSQSGAGTIPREFYNLPPEQAKAAIKKYLQEQKK